MPQTSGYGGSRRNVSYRPEFAMRSILTIATAVLFAAATGDVHAQTVETFYKGNRVTIDIGYTPGGVYDIYARAIARHLGKHPWPASGHSGQHARRRQHEGRQ